MHGTGISQWQHSHEFTADSSLAERRTRVVIAITAGMMVVEIVAGMAFKSMALLADGWHMGTHVTAFLITALAYYFSRRHASDPRFSFGTGKISVLGGYTSAVILAMIAVLMASESVHRLFAPQPIHYNDAIGVGSLGLVVNVVCALLLKGAHHHHGGHQHHHEDHHHQNVRMPDAPHTHDHHHDLNLRAAYFHVLADAFTSLTAIAALVLGKILGWTLLDPIVGLLGSIVVFSWAYSLVRDTSGVLLDCTPNTSDLPAEIRRAVESDGDSQVTDLHIWRINATKYAAIVSIVAHQPKSADAYRELFREHEELVHVTIEIQACHEDHQAPAHSL